MKIRFTVLHSRFMVVVVALWSVFEIVLRFRQIDRVVATVLPGSSLVCLAAGQSEIVGP